MHLGGTYTIHMLGTQKSRPPLNGNRTMKINPNVLSLKKTRRHHEDCLEARSRVKPLFQHVQCKGRQGQKDKNVFNVEQRPSRAVFVAKFSCAVTRLGDATSGAFAFNTGRGSTLESCSNSSN